MEPAERETRINELIDRYRSGGVALAEYLQTVDPALRDEFRARCEEAEFVDQFFDELAPLPGARTRPDQVGDYELIEPLGSGSMGDVFRARQAGLERDVAVKLIRDALLHRDDLVERFHREARLLASLDHPGIVRVLAFGEEDGFHFLAMQLVRGQSLASWRKTTEIAGARWHEAVARTVAEILDALAYAHGQGVVHRDLKPSNVMIEAGERPCLVDFGLAKALHDQQGTTRTVAGMLLGTVAYASPEAARSETRDPKDDDLWAVGIILFELLVGRVPYDATTTEKLLSQVAKPTPLDPRGFSAEVPRALAAIAKRALAPRVDDRYRSPQAFSADLRRFLAGERVEAERLWTWDRLARHATRHQKRYLAAVVLGLCAVGIWALAGARAESRAWTEEFKQVVAAEDRGSLAPAALALRASKLRELLADERATDSGRLVLRRELEEVERRARAEYDAGVTLIREGRGASDTKRAPSPWKQFNGVQRASVVAGILADAARATDLLEFGYARLNVLDPPGQAGAPVRVEAMDPLTGEPDQVVLEGRTPISRALPPGDYRIVVGSQASFAEHMRTHGAIPSEVVPRLLPTAPIHAGMASIPAGQAIVGQDEATAVLYPQTTVAHEAFYIDVTEVTCGQFHEYCLATGADLPRPWEGTYDPAWDQLPVVGVSQLQATAYAEWRGKRLPTWREWQIAARGRSGAVFPWGNDEAPARQLPTLGQPEEVDGRDVLWFEGVSPVGQQSLDTSWCGAKDMLGNIDEWTATPYVSLLQGVPYPVLPWRLRGGASWNDGVGRYSWLDVLGPGQPEWYGTGFRCAKSATP